jgi:hypothetical protein
MRRSVRDFERADPMYPADYGISALYAVEAMRPEQPVRIPRQSEVRAQQMKDGVICRDPIRYWEW